MIVFGVWFILREEDYPIQSIAYLVTAIKVFDLALLVYITNYLLIPKLLYKKKYVWFTIIFVLMIFGSSIIKMNILGRILDYPALYNWSSDIKQRLYDNVLPHFFLVIAGAAAKLMMDYGRLQKRLAEAAKEKAEAELNSLKSQMNPHFLFNSLNSVYFLIHKDNTDARGALHKFSEMLRYQLYEMNGEKIPVEKELTYLKDYVSLQQLRKDENYSVQFNCAPDIKEFSIEPLLLIPFVENAFKHISHHSDHSNFVRMNISRSNGSLLFSVENSREPAQVNNEKSGGIGLANVKRRLELLYPGRHELKIEQTDKIFSVKLNLRVI
jgi:LytS/YehU family sensor histidine kinase